MAPLMNARHTKVKLKSARWGRVLGCVHGNLNFLSKILRNMTRSTMKIHAIMKIIDLDRIHYQHRSCGRTVDDVVDVAYHRLPQPSLVERFWRLCLHALSPWSSRVRVNHWQQRITPPRACTCTSGKVQQGFTVQAWSTTGIYEDGDLNTWEGEREIRSSLIG